MGVDTLELEEVDVELLTLLLDVVEVDLLELEVLCNGVNKMISLLLFISISFSYRNYSLQKLVSTIQDVFSITDHS